MDLLPRHRDQFRSAGYWEEFFKKRGKKSFEWYGEYADICGILHKYVKTSDKILMVGCGNSQLSADMYDIGLQAITNVDISDVVIKQMKEKNKDRTEMSFVKMDVTKMDFEAGSFSTVIDKGTLDALFTDKSDDVVKTVEKMFAEIGRVLRVGGRYICVSLAQRHILDKIMDYFVGIGWPVRLHRVVEDPDKELEKEFHMPVFVFVMTKFMPMPNPIKILEVCYNEDKIERVSSTDEVVAVVESMQHYALARQQLNKRSLDANDGQINIELFSPASSSPRYTMNVVDRDVRVSKNRKFAIFIVPQGREVEWLFSTDQGRVQLAQSAGFKRLIVVALHRDQKYDSLDAIQAELSSKVMELAPPNLGDIKVPFLSIGDEIGQRSIKHRGTNKMTGDYVIEDVITEGDIMRRLIFLNNPMVVQSEARMTKVQIKKKGGKNKTTKMVVDTSHLACQFHVGMVAGLAFVEDFQKLSESRIDIALIGLGGGSLAMYLHDAYPNIYLDAIDIDPDTLQIATDWFDFQADDHLRVFICDGLAYIDKLAKQGLKKHVIMFDVDCKDMSLGMSCPPRAFVEKEVLEKVDKILHPEGVFILNLSCRNKDIEKEVLDEMKTVFRGMFSKQVQDDVNKLVYALPSSRSHSQDLKDAQLLGYNLRRTAGILQDLMKSRAASKKDGSAGLVAMLEDLVIV
ncbi:eEF1A lysine and N-terminal methyltransferase-like [Lineus longissimus]|uniref:eEF1A lysine and N-terminal methyltransferase-like n=1 Tax=Lineus longissimus TaxID=88925 RepID=UPI002B4CC841